MFAEWILIFMIHSKGKRMKPKNMRISNTLYKEEEKAAQCKGDFLGHEVE